MFQDDLVRSYRAFIDQRRTCGPTAEYREPTDEEWASSRTTLLRKLEHGTCCRPYGTPLRPRARLRPLPDAARHRRSSGLLAEIIANLGDWITEARASGWLGEVQGLQVSLPPPRPNWPAWTSGTSPQQPGRPRHPHHQGDQVTPSNDAAPWRALPPSMRNNRRCGGLARQFVVGSEHEAAAADLVEDRAVVSPQPDAKVGHPVAAPAGRAARRAAGRTATPRPAPVPARSPMWCCTAPAGAPRRPAASRGLSGRPRRRPYSCRYLVPMSPATCLIRSRRSGGRLQPAAARRRSKGVVRTRPPRCSGEGSSPMAATEGADPGSRQPRHARTSKDDKRRPLGSGSRLRGAVAGPPLRKRRRSLRPCTRGR